MKLKTHTLVLAMLVVGFIAMWGGRVDQDVAMAQGRKAVVITRIFTGPDGLAHAEDIELDLNARGATIGGIERIDGAWNARAIPNVKAIPNSGTTDVGLLSA